jgi:uncharacterized protein DUF4382
MGQLGCRASRFSVILIGVGLEALLLASCGGNGTFLGPQGTTGTVTTNISDPPTCAAPNGSFLKAWVTVTRVRAHLSADADPSANGWVDLADLRNNPAQVDLLSLASTSCLLNQLGSTSGLPPGNYQQIRVILLSNAPASGTAVPSSNPCGSNGFNCVALADGSVRTLQLTSEADTGIKIPPGQIAGGGINLIAGQSANLDIDFDACSSIVSQADGQFHLMPALHAGEASVSSKISGRVVDNSQPPNPIPNAIVLLEQPDSNGVDRKVFSSLAASDGTFAFCPAQASVAPSGAFFEVPQAAPGNYDVVVAGQTTSGLVTTTSNATIVFGVPAGSVVGDIPLLPESPSAAGSMSPATITGQVTTAGPGSTAVLADVTLSPLQRAAPAGGSPIQVTIPVFGATSQPPTLMTQSASTCPTGTDCGTYTLLVPASNPQVGTFATSGITFAAPSSGSVFYTVEADASTCTPTSQSSNQLTVITGGAPVTANFSFTGCQ